MSVVDIINGVTLMASPLTKASDHFTGRWQVNLDLLVDR
jgi:hypothetical protein